MHRGPGLSSNLRGCSGSSLGLSFLSGHGDALQPTRLPLSGGQVTGGVQAPPSPALLNQIAACHPLDVHAPFDDNGLQGKAVGGDLLQASG